ncbi:MAG TPA: thymidine phosphorylase [Ignavibacteriaceae bacterium]|nr:thymidine phosphorylase [Ignavibacteriaceae bacterium]
MNFIEIIKKKRDGSELSKSEITFSIENFTSGQIPDYQFSAFLMAVFLKGLNDKETSYLTDAMLRSGNVIDLSSVKGMKIDKHSTGGVGDKTSLIIAPIAAAVGVNVPMISGRGLGHTGGTLDKLESIPGFRADLSLSEYKTVLKKCGAVLIGQTKGIAPADKHIYALRDVTATVESIPLITASIMSKKIAEGIDGLVLDVKTGNGAFMKNPKDAIKLANSLIKTAKSFNKKVITFITDMNQPLGNNIGNWLEVIECIEVLQNKKRGDLLNLSLALAGAMIYLGKKAHTLKEGIKIAEETISNGGAFNKFLEIVKLQGGDIKYILSPDKYPGSKFSEKIYSTENGFVSQIDTYELGMASLELGAGRKSLQDKIDPKAGIIFNLKVGDKVKKGNEIATLFSDSSSKINIAKEMVINSIKLSSKKTRQLKLIKRILD